MGLVIAFVLLIGGIIKNFTPINNKWIPLITWALGGLLYQWLAGGWADPRQWMMALISVAGATGLHAATKSTFDKTDPSAGPSIAPPLSLLLICGLLSLGVLGCVTEKRLEVGGAYAGTAELAAQPELFVLDASFDLAHAALDATFKHEKANRAVLWKISPNIKRGLDKIRKEAGIVKGDYALARKIYEENPTPAGLHELQTALNKLQVLNVAALNVVEKKGNP